MTAVNLRTEDRLRISQMLTDYATALDGGDATGLALVLAARLRKLGTASGSMAKAFARDPAYGGQTEIAGLDFASSLARNSRAMRVSHHQVGLASIGFSGEAAARCHVGIRAVLQGSDSDSWLEVGGHYDHDLVKESEYWRIAFWRLDLRWERPLLGR